MNEAGRLRSPLVEEEAKDKTAVTEANTNLAERIAALEAAALALTDEVRNLREESTRLRDQMAKRSETNWSTIIAGIFLFLAVYGALIRPAEQQIDRQEKMINERNLRVEELTSRVAGNNARIEELQRAYDALRTEGSPSTAARLAVVENRLSITGRK